ncbi:MAG: sigma-70 family RNA polymerase sigma factor [Acidobacteria bacterium]|nr:sigma-70 family RNA polymerase sigma factor [Acidobacteriota bacterium]
MTRNKVAAKEILVLSGDQKLVERCLQGDDAAWEIVVSSYGKRIFNLSFRYINSREEAEDLTQEVFIRVYQNLKSYRAEAGSFQNWLLRVARNLIIDHYRQIRRYPQAGGSEELETMNVKDDKIPNPHRAAEQFEASQFLQDGLQALSPELKEAIILRDLEGMAYQDIAEVLSVPEGTVKSRINRGRLELARLLTKRRALLGFQM